MAEIRLEGLTKRFPSFTLGPIDLTIHDNEFFGIFGPPSSGKTSILRAMLGLLNPDEGNILINGEDVSGVSVDRRNLAMVFQNLALFPHMTGRENITFPLTEAGLPTSEVDSRLDRVAEVLHVAHILHKQPGQMSGGERQRIALGRAFVREPQAFLLDEPIAALDARLREEMRVELKRLQRENDHTFVYVSHDEEEVLSISDRVAILLDGRVAQVGPPDEIYDRPISLAVAQLVGSPPINVFSCELIDGGSKVKLVECDLTLPAPPQLAGQKNISCGVRPEHLLIDAGQTEAIKGTVVATEPLGGFTIIDASVGGKLFKLRLTGQPKIAEDEVLSVVPDPEQLHFFGEEGQRL